MEDINSILDTAEEAANWKDLKKYPRIQRDKDMKNMKDSFRDIKDRVRRNNMHLIRVS